MKARFRYERGMKYSLFFLYDFFASHSARLNFKRGKINKTNKECSIPRSYWKRALTGKKLTNMGIKPLGKTCET